MLGRDGWHTGGEVEFFSNPKYVFFKGKLEKESIGWLTSFSRDKPHFCLAKIKRCRIER